MKYIGYIVVFIGGLGAWGIYSLVNHEVEDWAWQDDVFRYTLHSKSAVFNEGANCYLSVRYVSSGELFFKRCVVYGLDTPGIPGFMSAELSADKKSLEIALRRDGGVHVITVPIPVHGDLGLSIRRVEGGANGTIREDR